MPRRPRSFRALVDLVCAAGYFGGGAISFAWSISVVHDALGTLGLILGVLFFPVVFTVAPVYLALRHDDYRLFLLTYGGALILAIIATYSNGKAEAGTR